MSALVEVEELFKHHHLPRSLAERLAGRPARVVRAVNGVSFTIARGETLGLIGESGCGKSTLGRALLRLHEPTGGRLRFDGIDLSAASGAALRALRRRMQIVFQDPYASLNPRHTVEAIIGLPLRLHEGLGRVAARERVAALLEKVGLSPRHLERYPHQFSGGQRQRIGIARALAAGPDFVVCDEPVSALDVSIQAQIIDLLQTLKRELGLTYLFISHDLAVVAHVSQRIAVMYLGEIVELAPTRDLVERPRHPYTQALLSAVPRLDGAGRGGRVRLTGDLPSPLAPPPGCAFHTRCPLAEPRCREAPPRPVMVAPGHSVSCHLVENGP
ncbi:MAG: dipeptide ABC transporter ATP-binding protein [Thalassobaculales bacterium]